MGLIPNLNVKTDTVSGVGPASDLLETKTGSTVTGPTFNASSMPAWLPWAGLGIGSLLLLLLGRKLWGS